VPEYSAMAALKASGIDPQSIDHLVLTSMDNCSTRADFSARLSYIRELLSLRDDISIDCMPHHLAHSALATLTSSFDTCVFLTLDAGGDGLMGHWGIFDGSRLSVKEEFTLSPAIVFAYITSLAGFSLFEEGKVMGLSAFGTVNDDLYSWLRRNFWIQKGGASLRLSDHVALRWLADVKPDDFDADFRRRHKYYRLRALFHQKSETEWLSEIPPCDIAATGQRFFEDLVLQAASNIISASGISDIAVSGGAFQNVVVNGKLRAIPGVRVHVPLAPHDAGLALGAGLLAVFNRCGARPGRDLSPYLGPSFSSVEIETAIAAFGLNHEPLSTARVATSLMEGNVVGWFQGPAEFGARALGARSVLADPRDSDAKAKVNQALKKRDWFMPYAPSILEECGSEYFSDFSVSPYMNTVFKVRSEKLRQIPSAIHVDNTCRAHSVNSTLNPRYHALLLDFYHRTGVPLILNTSFNRHGVPIVNTPRQAVEHLLEGHVDCLAIGEYFVPGKTRNMTIRVFDDQFNFAVDLLRFSSKLISRGRISQAQHLLNRLQPHVEATADGIKCAGAWLWRIDEPPAVFQHRWCTADMSNIATKD
jgi:carbamoyltransferase